MGTVLFLSIPLGPHKHRRRDSLLFIRSPIGIALGSRRLWLSESCPHRAGDSLLPHPSSSQPLSKGNVRFRRKGPGEKPGTDCAKGEGWRTKDEERRRRFGLGSQ